jgi:hypothetical protein
MEYWRMPKKPSVEAEARFGSDIRYYASLTPSVVVNASLNAANAMNHSAIFYILRLCGYPGEDIALLIRLYYRTFLFIGNHFGNNSACFLSRGAPQGADPSPYVSNIVFNPLHVIARVCARGCSAHGLCPNGSSGFADDSSFHTERLR